MILAVTGLKREAAILRRPGVRTIAGGGDHRRLEREIEAAIGDVVGVISVGLGGALKPGLRPGRWVVAERVIAAGEKHRCDPAWTARLAQTLGALLGDVIGSDAMVADVLDKRRLREETGAVAVDMESQIVGRIAEARGVPFAVARVISDGSDRALPRAAQVGIRPDGAMDLVAVLRSLASRPSEIPALIRTGLEAETAFGALLRGRQLLGPSMGLGADLR